MGLYGLFEQKSTLAQLHFCVLQYRIFSNERLGVYLMPKLLGAALKNGWHFFNVYDYFFYFLRLLFKCFFNVLVNFN